MSPLSRTHIQREADDIDRQLFALSERADAEERRAEADREDRLFGHRHP